jgi:hypothetical protein
MKISINLAIRNVKERSLKRKNTDALSINVIECRKMQNIGKECKKQGKLYL